MNAYVLHIRIRLIELIVQLQTVVHNGRKELPELTQQIGIRQFLLLFLLLLLLPLPLLLLCILLLLLLRVETKINCIVHNLSVPVNNIY